MAIATNTLKETLAASYAGRATYASLHAGDPGTTGANEVTGGTPAYARKLVTWNAGTEDGVYVSDELEFDVPEAVDVTHLGMWDAVTGGTFLDKGAAVASFASQGKYQITLTMTIV